MLLHSQSHCAAQDTTVSLQTGRATIQGHNVATGLTWEQRLGPGWPRTKWSPKHCVCQRRRTVSQAGKRHQPSSPFHFFNYDYSVFFCFLVHNILPQTEHSWPGHWALWWSLTKYHLRKPSRGGSKMALELPQWHSSDICCSLSKPGMLPAGVNQPCSSW